jgi:NAD+ synthase (glutamine-hydrolysing)
MIPPELIPDESMNFVFAPSAELKKNQIDPFWWGIDDRLVDMMVSYKKKSLHSILEDFYLEKDLSKVWGINPKLIPRYGINKGRTIDFVEHIEWLATLMEQSVFKRIQMPPIVILSKSAYGYDFRESQLPMLFTQEYKILRKKVLGELK